MRTRTRLIASLSICGFLVPAGTLLAQQRVLRTEKARQLGRPSPEELKKMKEKMRANDKAPKVGDEAPNFVLGMKDKDTKVQLASFKGSKPVVLVFGSYT